MLGMHLSIQSILQHQTVSTLSIQTEFLKTWMRLGCLDAFHSLPRYHTSAYFRVMSRALWNRVDGLLATVAPSSCLAASIIVTLVVQNNAADASGRNTPGTQSNQVSSSGLDSSRAQMATASSLTLQHVFGMPLSLGQRKGRGTWTVSGVGKSRPLSKEDDHAILHRCGSRHLRHMRVVPECMSVYAVSYKPNECISFYACTCMGN
jgi:hypothetical protein